MNPRPIIFITCLLVLPTDFSFAEGGVTAALRKRKEESAAKTREEAQKKKAGVEQSRTNLTIEMVTVPEGSFTMGCLSGRDFSCENDERPAHKVKIKSFELGKYEVTQGLWKLVMGNNPSTFKKCGNNCPVEEVSWEKAQVFIQKLNAKTGKKYRLPTEAEWEYAYRAGIKGSFYTGNCITTNQANYDGRFDFYDCGAKTGVYKGRTVVVGSYSPNPWGFYDMAGNVWEWVQDFYAPDYVGASTDGSARTASNLGPYRTNHVLRGGGWVSYPQIVRAAVRIKKVASNRHGLTGFRLARSLP